MDYRSWLSLDLEQEQSGSYYMNVKVDDSELVNELRNSIKMSEMYDPEEIIDEAFEILTDDMMIEALKERETHFYVRILNEVIPVDVIKEFTKMNFMKEEPKAIIDINETKKYLTETEQQMLLILIMKAAKEQLSQKIGDVE
jgi:uncharacterized protein with ATP-grasp and redox domains